MPSMKNSKERKFSWSANKELESCTKKIFEESFVDKSPSVIDLVSKGNTKKLEKDYPAYKLSNYVVSFFS